MSVTNGVNTSSRAFIDERFKRLCDEFPQCLKTHNDAELIIAHRERPEDKTKKRCRFVAIQNHLEGYEHAAVLVQSPGPVVLHELPDQIKKHLEESKSAMLVIVKDYPDSREEHRSTELTFTGNAYLFTDTLDASEEATRNHFAENDLKLIIRDDEQWKSHWKRLPNDFFLCHDSRDKEAFVEPLYQALMQRRVKVWYDKTALRPGDSLIQEIDEGLKTCRQGIFILSKRFLERKRWTDREFRSLITRELATGEKLIIPVWLDVGQEDVAEFSLELADRVAIKASDDVEKVADKLAGVAKANRRRRG